MLNLILYEHGFAFVTVYVKLELAVSTTWSNNHILYIHIYTMDFRQKQLANKILLLKIHFTDILTGTQTLKL